jgi:hypothetical protein
MRELITNLHIHTKYSDGTDSHIKIAQAALKSGLDVILTSDHNVLIQGVEGYYYPDVAISNNQPHRKSDKQEYRPLLLLSGEEIHDRTRMPQKDHLLVFGVQREMASYATDTQDLVNKVRQSGGVTFIAHPDEDALPFFGETDITWTNWSIEGFTGIEIWNGLSEIKTLFKSWLDSTFYVYNPHLIARGPKDETLKNWDSLLSMGKRVVAIGGSDAHALELNYGPLSPTIFPYEFHFKSINTHLLTPEYLTGSLEYDRQMVLHSLRQGHAFIGYDLAAQTRGFNFIAQGKGQTAIMGDEIPLKDGVTLNIRLPQRAECRLIRNGRLVEKWQNQEICTYIAGRAGTYRVECYMYKWGRQRAWILSNPIYVR